MMLYKFKLSNGKYFAYVLADNSIRAKEKVDMEIACSSFKLPKEEWETAELIEEWFEENVPGLFIVRINNV